MSMRWLVLNDQIFKSRCKIACILFFALSSFQASARPCVSLEGGGVNTVIEFAEMIQQVNNDRSLSTCELFAQARTKSDLTELISHEFKQQDKLIGPLASKDRHSVGQRLNHCAPSKDSTTLVINFTGTGAFEPRAFHLMEKLIKCPKSFQGSDDILKLSHYLALKEFRKHLNRAPKWSALEAGPMTSMLIDPQLSKRARHFDFVSFPSEESELIADPSSLSWSKLKQVPREMNKSNNNRPLGISNAIECVTRYYQKAKEMNIKPKLVVLSQSSGGRSSVKFMEEIKKRANPLTGKKDLSSDLVFSFDPVKEAHHAIEEVASQLAGKAGNAIIDAIPFVDVDPHKPVNVWSRKQPDSLYKTTNTKRWVNVYQMSDKDGLKTIPKFGIFGSPIHKADKNLFVKEGLDKSAHGTIAQHKDVLKLFRDEILSL